MEKFPSKVLSVTFCVERCFLDPINLKRELSFWVKEKKCQSKLLLILSRKGVSEGRYVSIHVRIPCGMVFVSAPQESGLHLGTMKDQLHHVNLFPKPVKLLFTKIEQIENLIYQFYPDDFLLRQQLFRLEAGIHAPLSRTTARSGVSFWNFYGPGSVDRPTLVRASLKQFKIVQPWIARINAAVKNRK